MSVVNVAGKLHPVTFNFSYSTFCLYNIGFLQLQIHVSWKTKLTVWQTPPWPDTVQTLRLELISRNQNGSRHDQGTGMGAEVRNIEYSIALKIKRGELMVPVWDYVAGRLGEGGRCKSNSPKLKLRSQLLFTATQNWSYEAEWSRNFDRRGLVKNWFGKLQNNLTKIVIVSRLRLPLGGTLRYLYKKNIKFLFN